MRPQCAATLSRKPPSLAATHRKCDRKQRSRQGHSCCSKLLDPPPPLPALHMLPLRGEYSSLLPLAVPFANSPFAPPLLSRCLSCLHMLRRANRCIAMPAEQCQAHPLLQRDAQNQTRKYREGGAANPAALCGHSMAHLAHPRDPAPIRRAPAAETQAPNTSTHLKQKSTSLMVACWPAAPAARAAAATSVSPATAWLRAVACCSGSAFREVQAVWVPQAVATAPAGRT